MNNLKNNMSAGRKVETLRMKEKRMLPFFIEFVKFSAVFASIIAVGLITLRFAVAAI